ncbi:MULTISPECIES: recombinase zinc beta ribbon domain-containing protein [Neobacillus]|uniref:Zinc ribbon domain-containing protein n=1 Tax=Neobacillus rhizophilus TaxID=2833579 RepID=A0A942U8V4_9BACI|nr:MULTISPECIES: recombinase zinc beta ribbon domain-containing protein [Neobacillus]MBS4214541.1 zinc ribbon domain-containing protein [Neobacillus rhizophilus]MBU8918445.1 zinc ribbon domain-containing protein [Bacillus sp. FJAT-29953]
MSFFAGKIYCNFCMKPFRRKPGNGPGKWVCQGNTHHHTCNPNTVEENWLKSVIGMRLYWDEKDYLDRLLEEQLNHIVFESKHRLVIKFNNPMIDEIRLFDGNNYYGSNFRVYDLGWQYEDVS